MGILLFKDGRTAEANNYYIVRKGNAEINCGNSIAAAWEAYDCFGRVDVTIEWHTEEVDLTGRRIQMWLWKANRMTRRMRKDGNYSYHIKDAKTYNIGCRDVG